MTDDKRVDKGLIISAVTGAIVSAIIEAIISEIKQVDLSLKIAGLVILPIIGALIGAWIVVVIRQVKSNNGVVKITAYRNRKRLPGEVFMAELLQKPVWIKKESNPKQICVEIDRSDVNELVISTSGKTLLTENYLKDKADHFSQIDRDIHKYITNRNWDEPPKDIPLNNDYKLRWASGGVLSVVTYRERNWIPLFFRDIRPYGWNISLGSSERQFDERNNTNNRVFLEELMNPDLFISREFLEETFVIKNGVNPGENRSKRVVLPFGKRNQKFREEYLHLRRELDKIHISIDEEDIHAKSINTNMTVKISSASNKIEPQSDVLVCFNLLELGIEIVKLLKFKIDDNDEILDGEILEKFDGKKMVKELVRMPVALLSCEILNDIFSQDITTFKCTEGIQPSIAIPTTIPSDHVHLFPWDVKRRLDKIKSPENISEFEKKRYYDWYDKFGDNFFNHNGEITKANISKLFTPATAKILNMFFANTSPKTWQEPIM